VTTPGAAEPRFPGFDLVDQRATWDGVTAGVVLSRLGTPPPIRFFSAAEEPTARALVDRLLEQDDDPKVPVIEMIDVRLLEQQGDGYRYEAMPVDWDAWRHSLANLDDDARAGHGRPFWDLRVADQMQIIDDVRQAKGEWHGLPAGRMFGVWMRYVCDAYYSHPWAWNEIGFGGPAYPRGYKNVGLDRRERWEVAESHPADPIPWVRQAEAARTRHQAALDAPPVAGQRP
jgi:hypothetical protein